MEDRGIYIHIPFCRSRCPYCDFYSLLYRSGSMAEDYSRAVIRELEKTKLMYGGCASTLYIGGGTPSCIGGKLLADIICAASEMCTSDAEITVECNPSSCGPALFRELAAAGVNRISMGMQSSCDSERRTLGRISPASAVNEAVESARIAGIDNISLDIMLGVPGQTAASAVESARFCTAVGASHVSAYMLKIEPDTNFYRRRDSLGLPDDDEVCDIYNAVCESLEESGFEQYEISNFARQGFSSRHNLKYWNDMEYVGIGPSAHSFVNGRRYHYERDIDGFMSSPEPVDDGEGGDIEEYAMLRLRLTEGIRDSLMRERFGTGIPEYMYKNALELPEGLAVADGGGIRLTRKGFLVSNAATVKILYGV